MAEGKNIKSAQIIVNGNLVEQDRESQAGHQVYKYHVNIHTEDHGTQLEYDREIHIFKPVPQNNIPQTPVTRPTETKAEQPAPDEIEAATINPNKPLTQAESSPSDKSDQPSATTKTNRKIWPGKMSKLITPSIKLPAIKLQTFKLRLIRIGSVIPRVLNKFSGKFKSTCQEFSLPAFKMGPRKWLPNNITRQQVIKLCLPCVLLPIAALLFYLQPDSTTQTQTNMPPIATNKPVNKIKPNKSYQAVIEKSGEGVVITLQGPQHDEVITKLPPGYDPVIEGNKIVHIVTPGNTLWFIAMRYIKNPYRYPELARLNNIRNPDLIYPGDKVVIQYIRKP